MATPDTPKVLIVDDQPRNLDALEVMLSSADCLPVRAESAEEALLHLLRDEFAAIVLDIRMPGTNGIELAQLIKQRKRSQHIPILFLTAHLADEKDVLRGYGVGAVDYLHKPINAEILRSKIAVFVDLYRKSRALSALNEALQREVTEREKAQEALQIANLQLEGRVRERTAALERAHRGVRENEERLRMAMEVAQMAAWEWHLATGHMTWSADPEELFGFPKGAFGEDLRIFHALHPDDRARMETTLADALVSGDYHGEFRALGADGRVVWITERGRVIYDADGVAERMVGVSRDVTADREAERERESLLRSAREARDEAERQMRFKDEFLAVLSHELRTPMNAVLGWLSILLSGKPVRDPKATLAIIQRNAQVQAKLIDDLLDMTRLMSGNIHLDLGTLDPAELVQATIHDLQPAAEAKGVRLSANVENPVAPITGDGRRLQQVLWNLVHNAIKFTPQGGRVVLGVRTADGHVSFTVHDTGRGISPDFLPYVFERFRQADPSTTREAFGLGLGLSIAKHLVELHGGTIAAVSEGDGRGAVFTVRVPRTAQVPTALLPPQAPDSNYSNDSSYSNYSNQA